MSKLRLLFIKEAQAAYISHLDLLRTMQRAFPRAGLEISHSHGFHPQPIISIVLPLPVGQCSDCELMDFEVTQDSDGTGITEKLNEVMPSGIHVRECYAACRPVRELSFLCADVEWIYDNGVPENAVGQFNELFSQHEIIIQKRTKRKDLVDIDIAHLIKSITFRQDKNKICAAAVVRAQNPGLNPQLLEKAVEQFRPDLIPNFSRIRRREVLDEKGEIFR